MRATRFFRPATLAGLVLVLAGLGGCAAMGTVSGEPYATIIVENDATMTVNIYALRQGTRLRLGQITGLKQREFPLRRSMVGGGGQLQLLIDPVGSPQNYPSQSILINEGDVIELQVSSFIR